MTNYVCDYAWARPDPHAIKAAGFLAVCRYLSHDRSGKTLTADEVRALTDAGLGIVLNFEDSSGRAAGGFAAGQADAAFANSLADQLGAPRDVPIYYSCDTDPGAGPNGVVAAYAAGIKSVAIRPAGGYGGSPYVRLFAWRWQSNAGSWDHGQACDPHMHQLYSHPASSLTIPGVAGSQYDTSIVLKPDFGAWGLTAVTPEVAPAPPIQSEEDTVYVTYQNQIHGFYVGKDKNLWQRFEDAHGNLQPPVNVSLASHFQANNIDASRGVHVVVALNGDLIVGVYGLDAVFNEARWSVAHSAWLPTTYR